MKCPLGISNLLPEISRLCHSIVSLYFFVLIPEEGFLISPCDSLALCIQMGISFLFSFAFHVSSFLSYLKGLLRLPFCLLAFLFLGDGFHQRLLYNDAGKDWRQEEKRMTEDEVVGWHYRLKGHEFEQTLRDGEGRERLACYSLRDHKESNMTE